MSFEYDDQNDLVGDGMPKGNKRAGFIGLMVAKARRPRGLQRGPDSYATAQRPKNTPANFDLTAIGSPSKDLQRRFGNRRIAKEKVGRKKLSVVEKSAKGRFTKEERDELKRLAADGNQAAADKLEEIQAAERARKGKQLGKEVKKRQPKKEKKTQAERFAEAQRGQEVQRVTIPTTDAPRAAPRAAAREEGDPTLAEDQRERVNAYMRRFGINEITEAAWKRMPRKDRQDYLDDAQQYGAIGRGKPTVSYTDYFAPNTIAGRALKTSAPQMKLDKISQALTQLAYYKDPKTKASFDAAKKKIDDPFNSLLRGLKSAADIAVQLGDIVPLNLAGKAVKFLYDKVGSPQLDQDFARDDAFKAKYEDKKATMDTYLANEQKLLEAYATAKKELEDYKLSQYKAYAVKGGRKPTDNQYLAFVKTSYQPTPPPQLEGFQLVVNTPTVDAFVDEATKSVVLTLRGTVPTDKKDLYADANIPLNRLAKTDRYIQDRAIVEQILQRYPPDQYEIYLTGHSLGGAIVNQLKRDFPMLKDAQTFNAAFQPYDLLRQQSGEIKRKYVSTDPLYKLGGRLFQNISVVPPKSKALSLGTIGKLYDSYQGHALANFEGSGRAVGGMDKDGNMLKVVKKTAADTAAETAKTDASINKGLQAIGYMKVGAQLVPIKEAHKAIQDKRAKEQFVKEASSALKDAMGKGKKKGKTITMPIKEFKAEHKRLVKALEPAAKELAAQKKEVMAYGFGKPMMKLVDAKGKVHRGSYHMMEDGSIHSGKTHTKRSKPLFVKE